MGRIPYKYNDVFSKSLLPLIDSCYVSDIAGSPGWVITNKKIPFAVTLSGLKRSVNTNIQFLIEYYDDFVGKLKIDYDNNGVENSTSVCDSSNTNTWKIVQISLSCRLNSLFTSDNNADFRLYSSSDTLADKTLKLRRLGMLYSDTQVIASWQTIGLESIIRETFLSLNNEGGGASINDTVTATDSTWSSSKINSQISTNSGSSINDELVNTTNSWSSSKTSTEINALISDTTTVTDKTWSSSKTNTTIQNAISGVTAGTSSGGSTVLKCNSTDGTPAASVSAPYGFRAILVGGDTYWTSDYPTHYVFHTAISCFNRTKDNQELFGFYNPDYPSIPFISLELIVYSEGTPDIQLTIRDRSTASNAIVKTAFDLGFNERFLRAYPILHTGILFDVTTKDIYLLINGILSQMFNDTNHDLVSGLYGGGDLHIGKNFEGNMHYFAIHGNNFVTTGTFPQKYTVPTRASIAANCQPSNGNTLYYDMQKRFNNYSMIYNMFSPKDVYSQEVYETPFSHNYHLTMGSSGSFIDNPFLYM